MLKQLEAISSEARLKIITFLGSIHPHGAAAATVGEMAGVRPSVASFHLGKLHDAELVERSRSGSYILYALDRERFLGLTFGLQSLVGPGSDSRVDTLHPNPDRKETTDETL